MINIMKKKANIDLTNKVCVEIGVREGDWSKVLLTKNPKDLFLVDCWKHQPGHIYVDRSNRSDIIQEALYQNLLNIYKNNSNVHIIRKMSIDAAEDFTDTFFDFIYLDANHEYECVTTDLERWFPKLKIGGWYTGHDWRYRRPDLPVRRAVIDFCTKNNIDILKLRLRGNSWAFQK